MATSSPENSTAAAGEEPVASASPEATSTPVAEGGRARRANAEPRKRAGARRGTVLDFSAAASASRKRRVAITGGAGIVGARLVRALAATGEWDVVVFDLAPAPNAPADVRHRFLDLTLPHADGTVYKLLCEERPDVFVHLAAMRNPMRDSVYAHELNSLGTLYVLAAAGEARVHRIVLGSTTFVYGARGDNPNFLTEEHALRPDPHDRFVGDFVEAEKYAKEHQRNHPDAKVTVLRFAPFLSPDVRDYKTKYFELPFAFTLLGYDPLLQALHTEDAIAALTAVLSRPEVRGAFNIAPDDALPLSTMQLLYGTLGVPIPHPLAYPLIETLWLSGIGLSPGVHAHYLRYLCVAANDKAKRVLGWSPRRTTLETVLETTRERRGRGRLLDFDALEETARRAAYALEQRLRDRREPATDRSSETRPAAGSTGKDTRASASQRTSRTSGVAS